MQIHVKTAEGKVVTLDVEPNHTIDSVKAKVHKATGIPPQQQHLTFESRKLEDGQTLSGSRIQHG